MGLVNEDNKQEIFEALEEVSYESYHLGEKDGLSMARETEHFVGYGKKEDWV